MARILRRNSSWPLDTVGFSSRPIADWIFAIIYPVDLIPIAEVGTFQLFATLTLNCIWRSKNLLVHDGVPLVPHAAISQISSTLELHTLALRDAALLSLWFPPPLGSLK